MQRNGGWIIQTSYSSIFLEARILLLVSQLPVNYQGKSCKEKQLMDQGLIFKDKYK